MKPTPVFLKEVGYPWSFAFTNFINASKEYISFTDKTTLIHDSSDEVKAKAVINRDLESLQKWSASW